MTTPLRDQYRIKVLAIINKDLDTASTKFRLVQYLDLLEKKGIVFDFINRKAINRHTLNKASGYNVVLNQKSLFNHSYAKKIISNAKHTVFDFDDAIYTRERKPYFWITRFRVHKRLHLWLKKADIVTTANRFLADYAHKFSENVKVIPMALDMNIWKPKKERYETKVTMGWAGAPVNIPLLEGLDPVLCHLLQAHSNLKLAVFSGRKPNLSCRYEYHPFVPGEEIPFIQNLDIGLLPLIDEEFYHGKSPIKAIQYLACGVPVVGNIIGAAREILNTENSINVSGEHEWIDAVKALIKNRGLMESMGLAGRKHVYANHNFETASALLIETILKFKTPSKGR